ncbi:MAG: hypothetical protein GY841_23550 [FCB group bacterium]|nr:hypothetical protein [FCB group bacterium]
MGEDGIGGHGSATQNRMAEETTQWHYRDGGEYSGPCTIVKPDTAFIMVPRTCYRCGGAGGADKWRHTGYTCFQCGGAGHLGNRKEKLYTLEKIAKLDATREKRRAREEKKRRDKREAEEAERKTGLVKTQAENRATYPDAVEILERDDLKGFLADIKEKHDTGHRLTERMAEAVLNAFKSMQERAEQNTAIEAFETATTEQEFGRQDIKAALLSVKDYPDNYSYDANAVVYKALWITEHGFKIFGTCPRGVSWPVDRGRVFYFKATIEFKEEGFGFYKRPTLATLEED